MNQIELQIIQPHAAQPSFARLSAPNGYRFEGDTVHLRARFTELNDAAHERSWALQLWACSTAPTSPETLSGGHIVAEVLLPPMSELADEAEHLDMTSLANIPAGSEAYHMALVLASDSEGRFSEIHDISVYPNMQQFLQPRIHGQVGYRIQGNEVELTVERIENPRNTLNRSGTLALELWALPTPYAGGAFSGEPLAGTAIGSLLGQTGLDSVSFDLPFSAPSEGTWHFVLMLREWSATGYVTRDFTNFSNVVVYDGKALTKEEPSAAASVKNEPAQNEIATAGKSSIDSSVARIGAAVQVPPLSHSGTEKSLRAAENMVTRASTASIASRPISINNSTEDELSEIDGISKKLARSIVKKRPFCTIDDLRRVKGVTVKLLAALKARVKL